MSNFLENIAYRQYENKLPDRYEEDPVFFCAMCGAEIYEGELKATVGRRTFCCECANIGYAERENCE